MENTKKLPLIILTGPTAVGKTELSLQLAKAVGGEIISADSMQVYRRMDIGTAKLPEAERQGVLHHLIDVLEPEEDFNVVKFQKMAKAAMKEIYGRGHIPILTGGTGFYIQAVLYDIDFEENGGDEGIRKELEERAEREGAGSLHRELEAVDPKAAEEIHENNVKRVIRALEYYRQTGKRISEHNEEQREKLSPYNQAYFVLTMDRGELYRRIDKRVDLMMEEGLLEEVKRFLEEGVPREAVSMQGLGYKEMVSYLLGECSLEEAVYVLKRDTRHFAKRQLTWFRRERDVIWVEKGSGRDSDGDFWGMMGVLRERGIIID
jgi:tRNA dimethylallyltransferase